MESHGAIEIFARHVIERTNLNDAGIVDQDVDFAEAIDSCPDSAMNLRVIEQVAFDGHNLATA
jgi:hypothetical protein